MESFFKNTIAALSILISLQSFAGFRVGNGGDYIRATYIRIGEAIVDFLVNTTQGADLVQKFELNLDILKNTLDIEKISVVDEILRDNSGSVVEAIGEPGSVKLNKESWFQHFEKQRDVYYLIFHEMLRSAAVNDDNYVISAALNDFPISRRVETRVVPVQPLISDDNLENIFDLKNVTIGGTGCPQSARNVKLEFDQEKNILEIVTPSYRNDVGPTRSVGIKSCQLAIPVKVSEKKRLVISQIDLLGRADLEIGAQTKLSFEAFLAGSSSVLKKRLIKPTTDPIKGRVLTRRTDILKSNCGGADTLRLNTNIMTASSKKKLEFFAINNLSLYLSVEDCK